MTELPQGKLLQSHVVPDVRTVLVEALDRSLTGYAIVVPRRADAKSVFSFDMGVPVLAYHTGADAGGERALVALEGVGRCRIDLYGLSRGQLRTVHETEELSVPPALPATHLTGDRALAARTRKRAAQRADADSDAEQHTNRAGDAVAAFLEDTERIETLREQARAEARRRANEWGLDEQLDDERL